MGGEAGREAPLAGQGALLELGIHQRGVRSVLHAQGDDRRCRTLAEGDALLPGRVSGTAASALA
jgi:hypothetical protein